MRFTLIRGEACASISNTIYPTPYASAKCAIKLKFKIPRRYWLLWSDTCAPAILTAIGLNFLLLEGFDLARRDPLVVSIVISVPILIWGSVLLVRNRRALNHIETETA